MILIKDRLLSQIPSHIVDEHPMFVKFMSAYFDWLEQEGNPAWVIRNLQDLNDIDLTVDSYVDHFLNILLPSFPSSLDFDKRLFLRYINDIKTTKGSEQSYKLLFQILFGESVELVYPKENVFRLSDGDWARDEIQLFTTAFNDVTLLNNKEVTQVHDTGVATGVVSKIQTTVNKGYFIHQINLTDVVGEFKYGYALDFGYDEPEYMYPAITSFDIVNAGSDYVANDRVVLSSGNYFTLTGKINPNHLVKLPVTAFVDKANITVYVDGVDIAQDFDWNGTTLSLLNYTAGLDVVVKLPSVEGFFRLGNPGLNNGVEQINIISPAIGYLEDGYSATVESVSGTGATVIPQTGIGYLKVDGYYTNNKGQLSSESRLHDGNYYQDFSYVIKSNRNFDEYSGIVKSLIHPAGTKMFGSLDMFENISMELGRLTDLSRALFNVDSTTTEQLRNSGYTKAMLHNNMSTYEKHENVTGHYDNLTDDLCKKTKFVPIVESVFNTTGIHYPNHPLAYKNLAIDGIHTKFDPAMLRTSGVSAYTVNKGSVTLDSGNLTLECTHADGDSYLFLTKDNNNSDYNVAITPNSKYRICVDIEGSDESTSIECYLKLSDGTFKGSGVVYATTTKTRYYFEYDLTSNSSANMLVRLDVNTTGQSATFSNMQIENISEAVVNATNYHPDPYNDFGYGWTSTNFSTTKVITENPSPREWVTQIEQTGDNTITATQTWYNNIKASVGDVITMSCIVKFPQDSEDCVLKLTYWGNNLSIKEIAIKNNMQVLYCNAGSYRILNAGNGFYYVETSTTITSPQDDIASRVMLFDSEGNTTAPTGSKFQIQCMFVGKHVADSTLLNDKPVNILNTSDGITFVPATPEVPCDLYAKNISILGRENEYVRIKLTSVADKVITAKFIWNTSPTEPLTHNTQNAIEFDVKPGVDCVYEFNMGLVQTWTYKDVFGMGVLVDTEHGNLLTIEYMSTGYKEQLVDKILRKFDFNGTTNGFTGYNATTALDYVSNVEYVNTTNLISSNPEEWFVNTVDTDGVLTLVTTNNPSGYEQVGQIEYTGTNKLTLHVLYNLSVVKGQHFYSAAIIKPLNNPNSGLRFRAFSDGVETSGVYVNGRTGASYFNIGSGSTNITILENGFLLVEVCMDVVDTTTNFDFHIEYAETDPTTGTNIVTHGTVGSKIYLCSLFAGYTGKQFGSVYYPEYFRKYKNYAITGVHKQFNPALLHSSGNSSFPAYGNRGVVNVYSNYFTITSNEADTYTYLGVSDTDYNLSIIPRSYYKISVDVISDVTNTAIQCYLRFADGVHKGKSAHANTTKQTQVFYFDCADNDSESAVVRFDVDTIGATVRFENIKIENISSNNLTTTNFYTSNTDVQSTNWANNLSGSAQLEYIPNPSGFDYVIRCTQTGSGWYTPASTYTENLSAPAGTVVRAGLLFKLYRDVPFTMSLYNSDSNGNNYTVSVKSDYPDNQLLTSNIDSFDVIDLGGGTYLIQYEFTLLADTDDMFSRITFVDYNTGNAATVGATADLQQVFIGIKPDELLDIEYKNSTNYISYWNNPRNWYGATSDKGTLTLNTVPNPFGFNSIAEVEVTDDDGWFVVVSSDYITDYSIGETVILSIVCKPLDNYSPSLRFRFSDSDGFLADLQLNPLSGNTGSNSAPYNIKPLQHGFYLMEVEHTITRESGSLLGQIMLWSNNNTGTAPIGSKLYVQSAFFGKKENSLGVVEYADNNLMTNPFDSSQWFYTSSRHSHSVVASVTPFGTSVAGMFTRTADDTYGAASIHQHTHSGNVYIGDKAVIAIVAKSVTNDNSLRLRFEDDSGFITSASINIDTGEHFSGVNSNQIVNVVQLSNGYKLFSTTVTLTRNSSALVAQIILEKKDQSVTAPSVNSAVIAQGAYFGIHQNPNLIYNNFTKNISGVVEYNATNNKVTNNTNPETWWGNTNSSSGTITNIDITNPSPESYVGLCEQTGTGEFHLIHAYIGTVTNGQQVYVSYVVKNINTPAIHITFNADGAYLSWCKVDASTGEIISASNKCKTYVVDLYDDYKLVQVVYNADANHEDFNVEVGLGSVSTEVAPVGSQLYVQSAYVGIANDWPGTYTDTTDTQDWVATDCVMYSKNGVLYLTNTKGWTANIEKNISVDSHKYDTLVIKWRRDSADTESKLQVRWFNPKTSEVLFFDENTITPSISHDTTGDYIVTSIDLTYYSSWMDNIEGLIRLRIDPGNGIDDLYAIDCVLLYASDEMDTYNNYNPINITQQDVVCSTVTDVHTHKFLGYNNTNAVQQFNSPADWLNGNGNGIITNSSLANPTQYDNVGVVEQTSSDTYHILTKSDPVACVVGDYVYSSILVRSECADNTALEMYFDTATHDSKVVIVIDSGEIINRTTIQPEVKRTKLTDGFWLIQCKYLVVEDGDVSGRFVLFNNNNGSLPVGTKTFVQCAFVGKCSTWPGVVEQVQDTYYPALVTHKDTNMYPSVVNKRNQSNCAMHVVANAIDGFIYNTNITPYVGNKNQYIECVVRYNNTDTNNQPLIHWLADGSSEYNVAQTVKSSVVNPTGEWQTIIFDGVNMHGGYTDSNITGMALKFTDTLSSYDIKQITVNERIVDNTIYSTDSVVYVNYTPMLDTSEYEAQTNTSYLFDGIDVEIALEEASFLYNTMYYYAPNRIRVFNEVNPVWPLRTDLARFSFNGTDNGAYLSNCNVDVKSSAIEVHSTQSDFYIKFHSSHNDFVPFVGDRNQQIIIKFRQSGGSVVLDSENTSLYFSNENGTENETRRMDIVSGSNISTTMTEYVYDVENYIHAETEWHGKTITSLRFDFAQYHPKSFEIDYIIVRSKRYND